MFKIFDSSSSSNGSTVLLRSSPGYGSVQFRRRSVREHLFIEGQSGLTLIEMVVTISLLGILLAIATGGLTQYFSGKSVQTSARELTSAIREAQALAVATGNTHRINLSGSDSYTLERRQGSAWTVVRGPTKLEGGVSFSSSPPPDFGGDSYLEFYARGTSEDGQLRLEGPFGKAKSLQVTGESVNVVEI